MSSVILTFARKNSVMWQVCVDIAAGKSRATVFGWVPYLSWPVVGTPSFCCAQPSPGFISLLVKSRFQIVAPYARTAVTATTVVCMTATAAFAELTRTATPPPPRLMEGNANLIHKVVKRSEWRPAPRVYLRFFEPTSFRRLSDVAGRRLVYLWRDIANYLHVFRVCLSASPLAEARAGVGPIARDRFGRRRHRCDRRRRSTGRHLCKKQGIARAWASASGGGGE